MRTKIWAALLVVSVKSLEAQSTAIRATDSNTPALPPDVNPVTYSRFPALPREEMKGGAREFFDNLPPLSSSGASLYQRGPQHMYYYSPALAETVGGVMENLQKQGVLGKRLTEIAVLTTARETSQQFIWAAHESTASKNSVEDSLVETIKHNKDVSGLGEKEATIIRYGRQLLREKKISSDLFAIAVKLFGYQGVVELTGTISHYVEVGIMLNAADQHLPPGKHALLPVQ